MLRRVALYACLSIVTLSACSKKQPPAPTPEQPVNNQPVRDTAAENAARRAQDQARQDSIAAAQRAADAERERLAREAVRTSLEAMVYFDYDASSIRDDAATTLGQKVQILRANPNIRLRITGHTDERGSVEYNLALGMRRAQSIKDYIVEFGIDESRLEIVSMGEDQPQDPGHDESAWGRNRRGTFTITAGQ